MGVQRMKRGDRPDWPSRRGDGRLVGMAEVVATAGEREIAWDGFFNARDLGGLPAAGGRRTRHGALIRSADLRFVTRAGWRAAFDAGVRTIVDLRNDDEVRPVDGPGLTALGGSAQLDPEPSGPFVPVGMTRVQVPLDGVEDVAFWRYLNDNLLNGTPLYYRPFLDRKPDRCAAAMTAIARAEPGGVIFHCGAGRDRTGLVALLLLRLAGVDPRVIADDYELSTRGVAALLATLGRDDPAPGLAGILAGRGTSAREAMLATANGFDAEAYLLTAGVDPADIAAIRRRLLEDPC
jgi:hypothetical protein